MLWMYNQWEVENVLTALKSSSAKDIYGMDTRLLTEINSSIVNVLMHIIIISLGHGRFTNSVEPVVAPPIFKGLTLFWLTGSLGF